MKLSKLSEEIEFSNKRYVLVNDMQQMFREKGYAFVEQQIIETYDGYMHTSSGIDIENTAKIMSNDGKINVLSTDITSEIVGNLVEKWQEEEEVKIFYYGKVFENTRYGLASARKLGAEYIGNHAMHADFEIVDMCIQLLEAYSGGDYVFEVGCGSFLKLLLRSMTLNHQSYAKMMDVIAKKDRFALEKMIADMNDTHSKLILSELFNLCGSMEEVDGLLQELYADQRLLETLKPLRQLNQHLMSRGSGGKVVFDLSLQTKLHYYSGIVFRGYFRKANDAVIKGGRYTAKSTSSSKEMTSVGFSVEIDQLMKLI